jgi:hypothetical protein
LNAASSVCAEADVGADTSVGKRPAMVSFCRDWRAKRDRSTQFRAGFTRKTGSTFSHPALGFSAGLFLLVAPAFAGEISAPLPSRAEARAVCAYARAHGPALQKELVKTGVLDANNDGFPDDVTVGVSEGTMRAEELAFRPRGAPKESRPIDVTTDEFQIGDYLPFGARWFPHGGKVYTFFFAAEDLSRPSFIGFIDAHNHQHLVCDFSVIENEVLKPATGRSSQQFCQKIEDKQDIRDLAVEDKELEIAGAERTWTRAVGTLVADFDNSGKPRQLAFLAFESGAGRGCHFGYFDAVTDGAVVDKGQDHDRLMRLQALDLADFFPNRDDCSGNRVRWFETGGKIYFEQASLPDSRATPPFHNVSLLRGANIELLCTGVFHALWAVKTMGERFK